MLLLVVGCGWRPVEGDEEDVGCVEAETPLLGGGDEDGGDGNLGLAGVATTLVGSGLWVWRGKSDEVRGVDGRAKGGALFCRLGLEDERKWGGMVMAGLVVCGGAVAWSGSCFSICRDS